MKQLTHWYYEAEGDREQHGFLLLNLAGAATSAAGVLAGQVDTVLGSFLVVTCIVAALVGWRDTEK